MWRTAAKVDVTFPGFVHRDGELLGRSDEAGGVRMRSIPRAPLWWFGVAILFAGSAATTFLLHRQSPVSGTSTATTKELDMADIRFYGSVIDDAGSPVPDARVDILISRVPPGSPPPDPSSARNVSPEDVRRFLNLRTDREGRFAVDDKGYTLTVGAIGKPGYDLVFDWSWGLPSTMTDRCQNRTFVYGGSFPVYIPDEQRPAIFPLHREGSSVVGMPSRGGSDQFADGRGVRNEPAAPRIPSTGPGAPKNDLERAERLRQMERSTTAP